MLGFPRIFGFSVGVRGFGCARSLSFSPNQSSVFQLPVIMAAGPMKQNVQVNAEDQKLINRFARLHQQSIDVKERLQEMSRDLQNLNDAADEVLLLDDADIQSVPFKIGSVFVHMDQDRLNVKLESVKGELETQVNDLTQKHEKICEEMESLKSILYGKFGESINLETDADG